MRLPLALIHFDGEEVLDSLRDFSKNLLHFAMWLVFDDIEPAGEKPRKSTAQCERKI